MSKINVGVIFGSRSVEHDVSVITAIQLMGNLDREKYNVIPIYISKEGKWLIGDVLKKIENFNDKSHLERKAEKAIISPDPNNKNLIPANQAFFSKAIKIDVIIPSIHGTNGEDGTIQGLLELANIPYVGAGVVGSAVGMDKIIMKAAFNENGLPAVKYVWFLKSEFSKTPQEVIKKVEETLNFPLFVKPANLGSSIGITKAKDKKSLEFAIEVACHYDRRILVEEAVDNATEINCSVLGNDDPIPSVLEEPIRYDEILSFTDKYLRGGKGSKGMASQTRRIPAPISQSLTQKIQDLAVKSFKAVDCSGIARIDFLLNKKTNEVFVNEINTIPGSFSFYLWEKSGYPFPKLLDRLIELAIQRHKEKQNNIYSFDSEILQKAKGSIAK